MRAHSKGRFISIYRFFNIILAKSYEVYIRTYYVIRKLKLIVFLYSCFMNACCALCSVLVCLLGRLLGAVLRRAGGAIAVALLGVASA